MANHWRSKEALGRTVFGRSIEAQFKRLKRNVGQGFEGVEIAPLPDITTVGCTASDVNDLAKSW